MIRILIADDHPIVREGLRQIIVETKDIIVAGEAESCKQALTMTQNNEYDIILMDITMNDGSGLEVVKNIKRIKPKTPVLMLSVHSEEHFALWALKAGASGYLTKSSAPSELIEAIRRAYRGETYISACLAQKLAFHAVDNSPKPAYYNLSDREYSVMSMIASGKTLKEIAAALSLSKQSISTYRSRILDKLNLRNNAELTHYAVTNGLVNSDLISTL